MMFTAVLALLTAGYIFCGVIISALLIAALKAKYLHVIFNTLMPTRHIQRTRNPSLHLAGVMDDSCSNLRHSGTPHNPLCTVRT